MGHDMRSPLSAYPSATKQAKEKLASNGIPATTEVHRATVETAIKIILHMMVSAFMSFSLVDVNIIGAGQVSCLSVCVIQLSICDRGVKKLDILPLGGGPPHVQFCKNSRINIGDLHNPNAHNPNLKKFLDNFSVL